MSDLIKQLVDHWVNETLVGGRKTGDMVVDGQTATEIAQFKALLAAKLREATPEGGGSGGGVESVTAGDASITVGGTATEPTVKLPYLVYVALLTQSGLGSPVATIKTNTIGEIVWSRSDAGVYLGTLNGAFPSGRTAVITGNILGFLYPELTADFVVMTTLDSNGSNTDGILTQAFIEIRVYPA